MPNVVPSSGNAYISFLNGLHRLSGFVVAQSEATLPANASDAPTFTLAPLASARFAVVSLLAPSCGVTLWNEPWILSLMGAIARE